MSKSNHIEKVAVVGATGRIGKYFAEALLKTGKHTVTALTREGSTGTLPEGVKVANVDFDDEETLVGALKGQQFLVITLSARAPETVHENLVKAAAKAGVKYIMPNAYGGDRRDIALGRESLYGVAIEKRLKDIEDHGLAYICMCCGFWYHWSLATSEAMYGFDIKNRKATFIDDGNTKITTSTWDQCGRALAALLSFPESGASPCVSDWKNECLYFNSFNISQRDILDSLCRVTGTTDKDWTITNEPHKQRYEDGLAEMQKGQFTGFAKAMYTRGFYPNGGGDFVHRGLANDVLSLPKEDLDVATKESVEMVENGWNPFGM